MIDIRREVVGLNLSLFFNNRSGYEISKMHCTVLVDLIQPYYYR